MKPSRPPLMDRKDNTGCTIPGRLNLPAIVTLIGNDAFDQPYWQGVLNNSRPLANIASGIRFD